VFSPLLNEYHPKDIMQMSVGSLSGYCQSKHMLSKVKVVVGARRVEIKLLCLYG
jgi:hypothetical protein